ncbi:MAG TPA: hypothetical protein VH349_07990 [Ktedonobacterales bacterium]
MRWHKEFKLRVVEPRVGPRVDVKELELPKLAAPAPRSAPTAQEVLGALRGMRGAKAVIARVPAMEYHLNWSEVAYFSVCGTRGAAAGGVFLWDCDHVGSVGSMEQNLANCYALFSAGEYDTLGSPGTLTGRACCFFTAPTGGYHIFNVQVEPYVNQPGQSRVECVVDGVSLGKIGFSGPINWPVVAMLAAGQHQFQIRQVSGAFFFQSVQVWTIPPIPVFTPE